MYELFTGPPEIDAEWDDRGIDGVFRYLNRTWKFIYEYKNKLIEPTKELEKARHKMIHDISTRFDNLSLNTVVSGFMENTTNIMSIAKSQGGIDKETIEAITIMLSPFVPHIAEELWEVTGHNKSVFYANWPIYDENKMKDDIIEIAIQVNGKLRDSIKVDAGISKDDALKMAKEAIASRLEGVEIVKEIYVPGKIVNIVVK